MEKFTHLINQIVLDIRVLPTGTQIYSTNRTATRSYLVFQQYLDSTAIVDSNEISQTIRSSLKNTNAVSMTKGIANISFTIVNSETQCQYNFATSKKASKLAYRLSRVKDEVTFENFTLPVPIVATIISLIGSMIAGKELFHIVTLSMSLFLITAIDKFMYVRLNNRISKLSNQDLSDKLNIVRSKNSIYHKSTALCLLQLTFLTIGMFYWYNM